jgi:zinc transporter
MAKLRAKPGIIGGKEIAFKDFRWGPLRRILPAYLRLCDSYISGLSFALVVDKTIPSLFGPGDAETTRRMTDALEETGLPSVCPDTVGGGPSLRRTPKRLSNCARTGGHLENVGQDWRPGLHDARLPGYFMRGPSTLRRPQSMGDGRPLFAFAFRSGLWQTLRDLAEADVAAGGADYIWVHLDLRDAEAQAWLSHRPWPPDVIEMATAPIQRGRLFITPDLLYGHLRDFRDEPDAPTLQAGSLCVVASKTLLVTGRRIPLLSIEEVRRRVEARTAQPATPFGVITEFFKALNDIGEGLLQEASEHLNAIGSKVLKRHGAGRREDLLEMRRSSIQVARDMAYKRTAMLELARDRPALFPADEFDRFNRQIHRYAALVEDAQDYAEDCQSLLEELRAQVEEETNRNIYILTMFSAMLLPASLITGIWGMSVGGIPFSGPNGFWVVSGLIAVVSAAVAIALFRLRFF